MTTTTMHAMTPINSDAMTPINSDCDKIIQEEPQNMLQNALQPILQKTDTNCLGIGAYGFVYTDESKANAWKHICIEDSAWIRDTFIVRSLKHPNIIKYDEIMPFFDCISSYSCGQVKYSKAKKAQLKLRMKKYDRSLACRRVWTDSEILMIMKSLLGALIHCHDNGILHRDVKEENVLLSWDASKQLDNVVLCDFGLAKCHFSYDPFLSRSVATISHRPPEVHKAIITDSKIKYDGGIDVWGICMILANLICNITFFKYVYRHSKTVMAETSMADIVSTYDLKNIDFDDDEEISFSKLLACPILFYKYFEQFLDAHARHLALKDTFLNIIRRGICPVKYRATAAELMQQLGGESCFTKALTPLAEHPAMIAVSKDSRIPFIMRDIYNFHLYLQSPHRIFQVFENVLKRIEKPSLRQAVVAYCLVERLLLDHYAHLSKIRRYWHPTCHWTRSQFNSEMVDIALILDFRIM